LSSARAQAPCGRSLFARLAARSSLTTRVVSAWLTKPRATQRGAESPDAAVASGERTSRLGRDLEVRVIVLLVARSKQGRHQRARVRRDGRPRSSACATCGERGACSDPATPRSGASQRRNTRAAQVSHAAAPGIRGAGARAAGCRPTGGCASVPPATHPAAPSRFRRRRATNTRASPPPEPAKRAWSAALHCARTNSAGTTFAQLCRS
jgi:hypothetical protein